MATAAYTAPGLTLAQVEARIAYSVFQQALASTTADQQAEIDQAITVAGQAASTWEGRTWWWLQTSRAIFDTHTKTIAAAASSGAVRTSNVSTITTTAVHGLQAGQIVKITCTDDSTFDGVFEIASTATTTTFTYKQSGDDVAAAAAGGGTVYVASYPLNTITVAGAVTATDASKVAPDIYAIHRIIVDDDYPLSMLRDKDEFDDYLTTFSTTSKPQQYTIYGDFNIGLVPIPDDAYTMTLSYIRRHSKVGAAISTDAALIVPAEFQWGVYVEGAIWLLKHKTLDPGALYECKSFRATMERMAAADPSVSYDGGQGYGYPPDTHVSISGPVSI